VTGTTTGREPPEDVLRVIDAMRCGEPVTVESLVTMEQRVWFANNCWSCLKRKALCRCILP
jgi:hypothetical protein